MCLVVTAVHCHATLPPYSGFSGWLIDCTYSLNWNSFPFWVTLVVKLIVFQISEGHCIPDVSICWQQYAIIINIISPDLFLCIFASPPYSCDLALVWEQWTLNSWLDYPWLLYISQAIPVTVEWPGNCDINIESWSSRSSWLSFQKLHQ